MISLATRMDQPEWRAFLDDHGMDWPQALLAGWDEKPWEEFPVGFIPDYAVIGPDGKIVDDGESTGLDAEKIKAAIAKALGHL
jgi:hypothetical protein